MTTIKHRNIVKEPMRNKPASLLPGVGEVIGSRMAQCGYERASQVYGQFLVFNRDRVRFEDWMRDNFQADRRHTANCYNALQDYYMQFN